VDSFDDDSGSIFTKDFIDAVAFILGHLEVLSSGKGGVVHGNWENWGQWIFLNTVGGESTVDAVAESLVVDKEFWIVSSIFFGHLIEFFFSEVEVKHGKNALELSFGNLSSSEFIEIEEKFFNSHSLHYNLSSKSILNIGWAITNVNSLFHESIVDDIKIGGVFEIVGRACISKSTV
jgi:hypothetical protein